MESSPSMVGSGDHRAGVPVVGVDRNRAGDHGVPMVGLAKRVRYAAAGANTKNEEAMANECQSSRWQF